MRLFITLILLSLIGTGSIFAQVHAWNNFPFLSAAAAEAATTRLTTELPNHEVHISYVVSFAGVPDSYRVYTDAGLLPFAEIPYSDRDYAPLSEAEQRRALNAAIHQAVGGVGASDAAIHIVYASVVSMGEGEGWSLSSRKYLHFGSGVSRLDQMKVRQIVPAPELEIAAPVSQNDTYLAAYVDELIAALKDPDYVVTGMIRYKGELYADGDTIYYFPTSNQTIANPMAGREWLELLINPRYPAAWTDWQEVGTSPALIEEKTATDAFLRLQPEHFQGVHTLQARYDEKIATVCFYPINLQVYLADETLAYIEPHSPVQEHTVYPYNNGRLITSHPGLTIRTRVEKSNGGFLPALTLSAPPSGASWLNFGIAPLNLSPADGRRYDIHVDLLNASDDVLHTAKRRMFVKWPYNPQKLVVTPTNNNGQLQSARKVNSNGNDTLYIVSSNNDVNRDVKFHLDWDGPRPQDFVDYWDHPAPGVVGEEPVYFFGASTANTPQTIAVPLTTRRAGDFRVAYDSRFFPGAGIFNPDVGDVDINHYRAGVHLFGESHEVNLAFLRENRRTQTLTLPDWLFFLEEKVNTFCNNAFDKIEAVMPIPLQIGTSIETSAGTTTFLTEDSDSHRFYINKEKSVGGTFGFNGNVTWDLSPGPWMTIGPYVDVGLSVGVAYEHAESRLHTESQFTTSAHTIEVPLEGRIALGGIAALNLHGQDTTGVNLSVNVNGAFPVELKGKIQNNVASPTGTCLIFEANGGPASLSIAVSVGAQFNWAGSNVDLNVFSYNWSYPVTDKYFLGPWGRKLSQADQEWNCD